MSTGPTSRTLDTLTPERFAHESNNRSPQVRRARQVRWLLGLMFISLGSIIGSGWLMGALNAAQVAGPASVLSWVLAAAMLSLLALVYAELGSAYPVAGVAGRFAYYSHGSLLPFAGWAAWLQAVFIGPIEVLACIAYVNSTEWAKTNFNMLDTADVNGRGLVVAFISMICTATAAAKSSV